MSRHRTDTACCYGKNFSKNVSQFPLSDGFEVFATRKQNQDGIFVAITCKKMEKDCHGTETSGGEMLKMSEPDGGIE